MLIYISSKLLLTVLTFSINVVISDLSALISFSISGGAEGPGLCGGLRGLAPDYLFISFGKFGNYILICYNILYINKYINIWQY